MRRYTKLFIKTGKNTGRNPSVASLHRALADAEEAAALDAVDDGLVIDCARASLVIGGQLRFPAGGQLVGAI
ncbi:hypothetical protein ACIBHX_13555 [Nonomuraea sp. NPDC050536]|uniref:hypothetical protein n=1 Tax=Nonomuraea sp. NPDC050536 TaxID=3364366 RepID=UPI0037CC6ED3